MTTYSIALPSEMDEVIDHANVSFKGIDNILGFRTLLPKVYGSAPTEIAPHYIAKVDGKVRGLVAVMRENTRVLGETLTCGFVGTVSVHPDYRNLGLMRGCMEMALADCEARGYDFLALGGMRQRYEHYGFEPGGRHVESHFDAHGFRHSFPDLDASGITFEPAEDRLDDILAIYDARPVAGARTRESFLNAAHSYKAVIHAAVRGGETIGYAISGVDLSGIGELALREPSDAAAVIKAWFAFSGRDSVSVRIPAWDKELTRFAASVCGGYSIGRDELYRILRPERVIKTYLELKKYIEGDIPDGELSLRGGLTADIRVRNGEITMGGGICKNVYEADLLELESLLISEFSYADKSRLPRGVREWFPLPVGFMGSDTF